MIFEKFNNILKSSFIKKKELIKDTQIYFPMHVFKPREYLFELSTADKELQKKIGDDFPYSMEGEYEALFSFTWDGPPGSVCSLGYYSFNNKDYFIWYHPDDEEVKFLCAFTTNEFTQSLHDFLEVYFSKAGLDYHSDGVWGPTKDYHPDEKNVDTTIISQETAEQYFKSAETYLEKIYEHPLTKEEVFAKEFPYGSRLNEPLALVLYPSSFVDDNFNKEFPTVTFEKGPSVGQVDDLRSSRKIIFANSSDLEKFKSKYRDYII